MIVALTLFASSVRLADAHALLLRSNPQPDVVLARAPSHIQLWFSEELNPTASQIVVWNRNRQAESAGTAAVIAGHPDQMQVNLKHLGPGSYLVHWTSVSATDGHVLHGYYSFSVKVRSATISPTGMGQDSGIVQLFGSSGPGMVVGHWIELLAAVIWVGAAIFSAFLLPGAIRYLPASAIEAERRRLSRLLRRFLLALFVSSGLVLLLQAYALTNGNWTSLLSPTPWLATLSSQYGRLWVARQAFVLLGLAATVTVSLTPRPVVSPSLAAMAHVDQAIWKQRTIVPGAIGILYLYLLAASGHAASINVGNLAGSQIISLSVFIDWLHNVAVACWFGGQAYIMLVLIPALQIGRSSRQTLRAFLDTLIRFSPIAYASLAVFTVSGSFLGKVHFSSWYAVFHSTYGQALIVKMTLVGLMMTVSALTVYILRPRLRRVMQPQTGSDIARVNVSSTQLARWLSVNPFLGAGGLLATSVMFYHPVAPNFGPPPSHAVTVAGSGINAGIVVAPDRVGLNQLTVNLRDVQRHPIGQASVTALTTMLDMNMGTATVDLHEASPGVFRGTVDLSLSGHWHIALLVYQPTGLIRLGTQVRIGQ